MRPALVIKLFQYADHDIHVMGHPSFEVEGMVCPSCVSSRPYLRALSSYVPGICDSIARNDTSHLGAEEVGSSLRQRLTRLHLRHWIRLPIALLSHFPRVAPQMHLLPLVPNKRLVLLTHLLMILLVHRSPRPCDFSPGLRASRAPMGRMMVRASAWRVPNGATRATCSPSRELLSLVVIAWSFSLASVTASVSAGLLSHRQRRILASRGALKQETSLRPRFFVVVLFLRQVRL